MARLVDLPSYQRFLRSVPVDLVCDIIQWAYVQEMGRWSEEDLLISVHLDDGSYCNRSYRGSSNTRVDTEMGCDAKECRFYFFWLVALQCGRILFTITGPLRLALAGRSLSCRSLRYIMAEGYNVIVISFVICHSTNSPVRCHSQGYWFTYLQ